MKGVDKKFLGLFLLGILVISFIGVVAAQTNVDVLLEKINVNIFDGTGDKLAENAGFAKFLLFVLVFLIVFAISGFIPFLEGKNIVQFILGIVVSLLSILYLDSTEIQSILLSYETFGIVLTTLIPFVLIFFMSIKLQEKEHGFFSKAIWIIFGVVLIIRWAVAPVSEIGMFGKLVYPITALAVLIMFIWEKNIYRAILKEKTVGKIDKFKQKIKLQAVKRDTEAEDVAGGAV